MLKEAEDEVGASREASEPTIHLFVDLERRVHRNGKLIASHTYGQIDTIGTIGLQEGLSQTCMDRLEKAERVAATRTKTAGVPLRALAHHLRTPLFAPGGALGDLSPIAQRQLQHKAQTLGEVFQRLRSNVEGRNGYLSLRSHQLRGLDYPRKRAYLTAVHNFFASRMQTGRSRRSGFSGRGPDRCLPRFGSG